jgi:alkylated DNA repair dioxygenase AlkB
MQPQQLGLFGQGAPAIDEHFAGLQHLDLGLGAWIDLVPGWVRGERALFDELERGGAWQRERRRMYEREVDTPRLLARAPAHALLAAMRRCLSARYGEDFVRVTMALYRHGQDSVAMHGDTTARDLVRATVATVSLGAARRFVLRPTAGGHGRALLLGGGDLLVMGGTAQRTWRHGIPKVARAGARLAVMFRPSWGEGQV